MVQVMVGVVRMSTQVLFCYSNLRLRKPVTPEPLGRAGTSSLRHRGGPARRR